MDSTGQVHLLLGSPGQPPPTLPPSPWAFWVLGNEGAVDPGTVAGRARVSPVAPRPERSLLTAVATDDLDGILRLCGPGGSVHDAARILAAGRLGSVEVGAAIEMTTGVLRDMTDPGAPKTLRRHWPELHVAAPLAPSVPALIPVSRVGLGLLLADLHLSTGRPAEALAVLQSLPSHPAVRLAVAATLLGNGELDRVLAATTDLANIDDVSALALVARSVAARSTQDLSSALDAACAALSAGDRSPGVLAAALEERSHIYSLADHADAARADLEALAVLAAGLEAVEVPPPTALVRAASSAPAVEQSRDRARDRMRRRITGVGAPGTFGGRHHSTYLDEIAAMFALGQTAAVEELLLGLLDAVEDEVAELGAPLDPTFFLTLADLYHDCGRTEDLAALRDRFAAAEARSTPEVPAPAPVPAGVDRSPSPVALAPVELAPGGFAPAGEGTTSHPPAAVATLEAPTASDSAPLPVRRPAPVTPSTKVPAALATEATGTPSGSIVTDDPLAGTPGTDEPLESEPSGGEALGDTASIIAEPELPAPAPRALTAVERTVRGPRVRSL